MTRLTPTTFSCYPATGPLYDALADKTGTTHDNILVGAGSDWVIRNIFDVFCSPGTRVVMPVPTYGMYEIYAEANQAQVVSLPYRDDFGFPEEAVLGELTRGAGIVALTNPNGAIGSAIPRSVLDQVLTAAQAANALVIMDEAYIEYGDTDYADAVHTVPNLILVRTFSKALGLAGLRVGYALAAKPLIASLSKLRPNVEVNQVGVEAALYLLENEHLVRAQVAAGLHGKAYLSEHLQALGFRVYEGRANFIQVAFGPWRQQLIKRLQAEDILVKDEQDDLLREWTRITIGPQQEMSRIVECVRTGMNG